MRRRRARASRCAPSSSSNRPGAGLRIVGFGPGRDNLDDKKAGRIPIRPNRDTECLSRCRTGFEKMADRLASSLTSVDRGGIDPMDSRHSPARVAVSMRRHWAEAESIPLEELELPGAEP